MIIKNISDVEPFQAPTEGQIGRVMIGPKEGTPTFVMRVFEFLKPGVVVYSPKEEDWEFEVLILSGKGVVLGEGDSESPVGPMDFIYFEPNEVFGIKSTGTDVFRFLCAVPLRGHKYTD